MSMAESFYEYFTSMPSKIVNEINPIHTLNIPPFACNLFESSEEEGDIPLFSFSNSTLSVNEIIDATIGYAKAFSSYWRNVPQDTCRK